MSVIALRRGRLHIEKPLLVLAMSFLACSLWWPGTALGHDLESLRSLMHKELDAVEAKYSEMARQAAGNPDGTVNADSEAYRKVEAEYMDQMQKVRKKYSRLDPRIPELQRIQKQYGDLIVNSGSGATLADAKADPSPGQGKKPKDLKPPKDVRADLDLTAKTDEAARQLVDEWRRNGDYTITYDPKTGKYVSKMHDATIWEPATPERQKARQADSDAFVTPGGKKGVGVTGPEAITDPLGYALDNKQKFQHARDGMDMKTMGKSLSKAAENVGHTTPLTRQADALRNYKSPYEVGIVRLGESKAVQEKKLKQWVNKAEADFGVAEYKAKRRSEDIQKARRNMADTVEKTAKGSADQNWKDQLGDEPGQSRKRKGGGVDDTADQIRKRADFIDKANADAAKRVSGSDGQTSRSGSGEQGERGADGRRSTSHDSDTTAGRGPNADGDVETGRRSTADADADPPVRRGVDGESDVSAKRGTDADTGGDADAGRKSTVDADADAPARRGVDGETDVSARRGADADAGGEAGGRSTVDADADAPVRRGVDTETDVSAGRGTDADAGGDADAGRRSTVDADADTPARRGVDGETDVSVRPGTDADIDPPARRGVDADRDVSVRRGPDADIDPPARRGVDADRDVSVKRRVDVDTDVSVRRAPGADGPSKPTAPTGDGMVQKGMNAADKADMIIQGIEITTTIVEGIKEGDAAKAASPILGQDTSERARMKNAYEWAELEGKTLDAREQEVAAEIEAKLRRMGATRAEARKARNSFEEGDRIGFHQNVARIKEKGIKDDGQRALEVAGPLQEEDGLKERFKEGGRQAGRYIDSFYGGLVEKTEASVEERKKWGAEQDRTQKSIQDNVDNQLVKKMMRMGVPYEEARRAVDLKRSGDPTELKRIAEHLQKTGAVDPETGRSGLETTGLTDAFEGEEYWKEIKDNVWTQLEGKGKTVLKPLDMIYEWHEENKLAEMRRNERAAKVYQVLRGNGVPKDEALAAARAFAEDENSPDFRDIYRKYVAGKRREKTPGPDVTVKHKSLVEYLTSLNNHKKVEKVFDHLGVKPSQEFLNGLCRAAGYGSPGTAQYYHPDTIGKENPKYSCNRPGDPCIVAGFGCTRHPLPSDPKIWEQCLAIYRLDMEKDDKGKVVPDTGQRLDDVMMKKIRERKVSKAAATP